MPNTIEVMKRFTSIMRDPLAFLLDMSRTYGDSVSFNLPEEKARLINHPDLIQYVLQTNHRNYNKKTPQFETFSMVTGNGMINSDGDFWLRQRRTAQPAFHQRKINTMVAVMQQETEKRRERWQTAVDTHQSLDMEQEMLQLTLGITMKALFQMDIGGREAELVHLIEETLGYVMFRAQVMVPVPPTWPLPVNRRYRGAMKELDKLVMELIANRRQQPSGDDVLSLFIDATDDGQPLSDQMIRDEILTLIIAGYETAASGLVWMWYLLSQHPEIAEKLRHELLTVLNGRSPGLSDFGNLPYLKQVIHEGWRLYPPSWVISRSAVADDRLGDEPIGAGTLVIMSPYTMHRHPKFWPDPDRFDPERFTPEAINGRSRYAYIPFGGGPRLCIGNSFAEMETMVILGTLFQQFDPEPITPNKLKTRALVTIRPKHGLPMRMRTAELTP